MKLLILSEKEEWGFITLSVMIDKKEYTFYLSSEYGLRQIKNALKRKNPGRALKLLKQFNHRDVYEKEKENV